MAASVNAPHNHQTCQLSKRINRLSRYRQIKLTVIGRKSGKAITNPV
jgi:hypothetical protein